MTLFEVLNALCFIEKQVTSTHFATNITKIDSNIGGDWKGWNIKFHTEEEPIDEKELDRLADDYAVNSTKEFNFPCMPIKQFLYEGFKAGYRKAMEEQI